MHDFNLAFYFISLAILCTYTFCQGATHWIVTEDGRIQQQTDSIFNLKSPYDLVTFIHQQNAFERLKILREEYLIEKRKVIEAREKEREVIQKSFYKVDPDCIEAGSHISQFELHLEMTLPFTKKGINIPDHVNLCESLPLHVEPPLCRAALPTVVYSYDHLEGINGREQLNGSMEPALLTSVSSYFKTVDELGGRVSLALEKNSSSWILLNLAAYYWRIKGNALEAVECLRQALYFSPREHKDRALIGLSAVLYHANHSHDSLVLLHTAVDTCNELSIYHFLLGNIYASLKMYEMAELCYRFTMVVSPDTKLLCERIKAVRCELKIKEMFKDRQLAFDEKLDSPKTPELDETKDLSREEADNKRFLPLEIYKRQLNRVFSLYTQGRTKYTDACKSRTVAVPAKQESRLSTDHVEANEKHTSQVRKEESEHSTNNQQDSIHQTTQHTSSRVQSTSQEKQIKAKPSNPQETQKYGDTNGEKSMKSSRVEGNNQGETQKASTSGEDNKNISTKEKTMHNLAEARLALNRLKSVIQTVSHAHESASRTVDGTEADKGLQSDSRTDRKNDDKLTIPHKSKPSSIQTTSTVDEKSSQVKKVRNPARMSRRGESGFKISKNDPLNREDTAKPVTAEEAIFSRQKGESIVMSKNIPDLKLDNIASKNTREISNADLLFEEPSGSRPIGPKHTPPLESKHMLTRGKKCGNLDRKKQKGEAYAMECVTQDPNSQSVTTESNEHEEQFASKTEFSKAATKGQEKTTDSTPLSDAEVVLMKKTLADDISNTASAKASVSDSTSEIKLVENTDKKTSGADHVKNTKTSIVKEERDTGFRNSDSKLVDGVELKTAVEDVTKSKSSDEESNSVKQHEQMASRGDKNPDAKVAVKNEVETIPQFTSHGENSNLKQLGKKEEKDSTSENVKSISSDSKSDDFKQSTRDITTGGSEKPSGGQKSSAKIDPEQKNSKSRSKNPFNGGETSQNVKEKVKEAEHLYKVGAGSCVFETSFMNVPTSGSLQELNDEECKHIEGIQALVIRNQQFSAWLSLDTKNIDVKAHIDFLSEVDDLPKKPRCTAKMKSNLHTFGGLQGVGDADKLDHVAEAGLTQVLFVSCLKSGISVDSAQFSFNYRAGTVMPCLTLLTIGKTMQDSIEEMGTRIYNALEKNSTSWVLLNIASLYWRVQGDTVEAIKCLRRALYFSPAKTRDVAHVGLASILLREGRLDDTAVVIKKALEVSPSLALGHFILGNVFGAQSNIPDAIQHYLLALQLEPGFTPAVERLKIIQCVLWKQQKALEKEAEDLKKLLAPN